LAPEIFIPDAHGTKMWPVKMVLVSGACVMGLVPLRVTFAI